MTTSPEVSTKLVFEPWFWAVKTLVAFQWKLLEAQYRVGEKILEGAFPQVPSCSPKGDPKHSFDVDQLEELAATRIRQGLAPPREIYQIPYRNRIDWAKFPEWAKPCDPELFEGSAHEG